MPLALLSQHVVLPTCGHLPEEMKALRVKKWIIKAMTSFKSQSGAPALLGTRGQNI